MKKIIIVTGLSGLQWAICVEWCYLNQYLSILLFDIHYPALFLCFFCFYNQHLIQIFSLLTAQYWVVSVHVKAGKASVMCRAVGLQYWETVLWKLWKLCNPHTVGWQCAKMRFIYFFSCPTVVTGPVPAYQWCTNERWALIRRALPGCRKR